MMKSYSIMLLSRVYFCVPKHNAHKLIFVNFLRKSVGKYVKSIVQAISDILDSAKLLVGGVGFNGWPQHLIDAIGTKGCKNLTIVAFNVGIDGVGLSKLLSQQQIKRLVTCYIGENPEFGKQYSNGNLELELVSQGTLAERIRAGGAGIPAFFTSPGHGTVIQTGDWVIKFDSKKNPLIFTAKLTIVEAEEIVEVGELDPDEIHVPGIYVDRIFKGSNYDKDKCSSILKVTKSVLELVASSVLSSLNKKREIILRPVALEFKNNMYVNLGLGLPMLAPTYVKKDVDAIFQFDSGILNFTYDPDSKEIYLLGDYGHLDLTILGGLQVSKNGDLANWIAPGALITGTGGSMDLVTAPNVKVIVTMEHITRDGSPRILENCTLLLIGKQCVDMIITDLAVFEVSQGKGLHLIELTTNVDLNEVINSTGCEFSVSDNLKVMEQITKTDD
ncbi:hypothetical protein KQX54_005801 [Cotesia glomerata]|uniref:Succinyl-CoA:3-ketoacid-coenzyme A transferase n=1 Tax=Cotesia glomerata TaxID=32391 RepID=A0AAV7I9P6_COTGL|nr:hypothetical protein KQX54_005801 [Cotesia glomerata]